MQKPMYFCGGVWALKMSLLITGSLLFLAISQTMSRPIDIDPEVIKALNLDLDKEQKEDKIHEMYEEVNLEQDILFKEEHLPEEVKQHEDIKQKGNTTAKVNPVNTKETLKTSQPSSTDSIEIDEKKVAEMLDEITVAAKRFVVKHPEIQKFMKRHWPKGESYAQTFLDMASVFMEEVLDSEDDETVLPMISKA